MAGVSRGILSATVNSCLREGELRLVLESDKAKADCSRKESSVRASLKVVVYGASILPTSVLASFPVVPFVAAEGAAPPSSPPRGCAR